jgi:flagellar hook-basal body protein
VPPNQPLWNGKNDSGTDVGAGNYTVSVYTAPTTGGVDTVQYNLLTSASVTFNVYNSAGTEVASINTPTQAAGTNSFSWNGLDNTGNPVAPGTYTYQVSTSKDGKTEAISGAQVHLTVFPNESGLISQGNNLYTTGPTSGSPIDSGSGWNQTKGTIQGDSLESSNVDMTTELTNMIIYQEAYTANTKSITSAKQMMDETVNLVT